MRIAIVGTELSAVDVRGGGLEQVLRRWAAGLAVAHDVVVVSHRSPQPGADPYDVIGVDRTADVAAALAAWRPDVVSLHNRPHWADLAPEGAAVGVTFHNYPVAWKMRRPPRRLPGLSAVSGALALAAGDALGVRGVTVVAPSIDPAFLAAPRWRPSPVVLSPNRLLRKKGPLVLLAVARRRQFRDVRFDFTDVISPWARPTPEHRALRAAIRETANARLVPPSDPARLAERMAAGVVVCPVTEPEGLGLVALEAQACGAPLVASRAGGLAEATLPPNRLVPPGDAGALGDAIRAALDGAPAEVEARGEARRVVRRRYAPGASLAAMERWLLSLVSRCAG